MSIWSTLFSSSKTVGDITSAIISTGDKLFYTDEEKADAKKLQREFFPTLLKAYEPFKIAQRILAMWFAFLFGVSFLIGLSMEVFNIFIKYQSLKEGVLNPVLLYTSPLIALVGAFSLGTIMIAIIGFYFMGGTLESFKRNK